MSAPFLSDFRTVYQEREIKLPAVIPDMEITAFHVAVFQKYVRMFRDHLLVRDDIKMPALIELHHDIPTGILHKNREHSTTSLLSKRLD